MATSSQPAPTPASVGSPTFADLFDLVYESRERTNEAGLFYDPWLDLGRRRGVEVDFHNPGRQHQWKDPRGITYFYELRVTLRFAMMDMQMRCTLAHELAHLDRGPRRGRISESVDEARTSLLAAQRLVNPRVFDRLQEVCDGKPSNWEIHAALNVDRGTYATYLAWRKKRKQSTALKMYDESRVPTPWPALWIGEQVLLSPGEHPVLEALLQSDEDDPMPKEVPALIAEKRAAMARA